MKTTIITAASIFLLICFLLTITEQNFTNLSSEEAKESYEIKNDSGEKLNDEEVVEQVYYAEPVDDWNQTSSITNENKSEENQDLCTNDCTTEKPICDTQECEGEEPIIDESVCKLEECYVYLPICNESTCVEEIIEAETLYIPNNVEQCIDLFYDIDLATDSMIEFESENDIMATYRGLCNELVNFKPSTYDEFINNRPTGFPPMPVKVDQLGKYLFDTYVILYEENI